VIRHIAAETRRQYREERQREKRRRRFERGYAHDLGLSPGTLEWKEYQLERERRNRIRRNLKPGYRDRERDRHLRVKQKEMAPIRALRELGWLDGYNIVVDPNDDRCSVQEYRQLIRRWSGRYFVADFRTRQHILDQLVFITGRQRLKIRSAFYARTKNKLHGVIIVDGKGVARLPIKKRYRYERYDRTDVKRKAVLAALHNMGWLRNGEFVPVEGPPS
jgi:hypothetical protein